MSVVIVTQTIMSGQVARWYPNVNAAKYGTAIVSASREGVVGHGGFIRPDHFAEAWAAHLRLVRREDVRDIATHTQPFGSDTVAPVLAIEGDKKA